MPISRQVRITLKSDFSTICYEYFFEHIKQLKLKIKNAKRLIFTFQIASLLSWLYQKQWLIILYR